MRRSAVWFHLAFLGLLLAALMACGGGSSNPAATAKNIIAAPSSVSIDTGQVTGISVATTDANGNAVTPGTITFSSSNTSVATVSSAGAICGGTWDANFIVCTPGAVGTATITVTSGSLSTTVSVAVHAHIDRLVVSPSSVNCKSQGQTAQMTAQALHNGTDITSTVGPITWSTGSATVATVDSNGLVTAVAPGLVNVSASVGSTNSLPASFITCPVQTIRIHLSGASDVGFTLAPSATQQLAADVLDSAGIAVNVTLTWSSSQSVVAGVGTTGLATAGQPGTASITASCFSPGCNFALPSVYSNVVTATVTGTSANTVYAAGTGSTSLVPIDSSTNTAATAITLPAQPNSMLVNRQGTSVFLGSSGGLITVTTSSNAVANDTAHPGTVLAVSPDGIWVVVAGASSVFLVNTSNSASTQTLSIAGATAAAFTPDSNKLFIAAGSTLWSVIPAAAFASHIAVPVTLADATVLASGAYAYFGSSAGNSVLAVASCSNTTTDTQVRPGSPTLIRTLPDGSAVLAVESPGIDVITPNTTLAGCPPPLTDNLVSKDFLQGPFTARQLIVLPNSSKAYVTSDQPRLMVYDVATGGASTITLAGTATTASTGGALLDSTSVYVGGSDNAVHRIDVTGATDAQQISVGFTPDLVAVRPK